MNKSINSKLNINSSILVFGFILMVVLALGGAIPEKVEAQYYGGYSGYATSPYSSYGDAPTIPTQPQQPKVVYVPVTKTVTRTVVRNVSSNSSLNNTNTTAYNNQNNSNQNTQNIDEKRVSDLAANSLFGSKSFVPNGLIGWIIFAILILIIVMLVRKVFGGEDRYHAAPLKHA